MMTLVAEKSNWKFELCMTYFFLFFIFCTHVIFNDAEQFSNVNFDFQAVFSTAKIHTKAQIVKMSIFCG